MLTVSYTHRFGGTGEGFQFGNLLGRDRGRLRGRVFADLNGNGRDDESEQGVAGVKVRLDEKTTVVTDERGRFQFPATKPGDYTVSLLSDDLGVQFRASTASEQQVALSSRQKSDVNFGVTNFGFIGGRVFNDLLLTGSLSGIAPLGIAGVRLNLRVTNGSGRRSSALITNYRLKRPVRVPQPPPGSYTLELDPETLPPDYRLPSQIEWKVKVEPLQGSYQDIPVAAQHAVSGVIFIDKDSDGRFDAQKDEPVAGARVVAGSREAVTDAGGAYILRNLPAGTVDVRITATGCEERRAMIELGAEPTLMRGVSFSVVRVLIKSQSR